MLAVISFIWQILSTHSALGSEPGPDIPRSPSHYLPETLIIIMLFQQMSPFQWKLPSHSLSADWVVPTSDLQLPPLLTFVCFCSICSQIFHLRGPMQAHPGCVCPPHPLWWVSWLSEGEPQGTSSSQWWVLAEGGRVPPTVYKKPCFMQAPLWSSYPLYEVRKGVAISQMRKVSSETMWVVKVQKDSIVEMNPKQGLEGAGLAKQKWVSFLTRQKQISTLHFIK